MERERIIRRNRIIKRLALGAGAAVLAVSAVNSDSASAQQPYEYQPVPQTLLHPIDEKEFSPPESTPSLIPSPVSSPTVVFERRSKDRIKTYPTPTPSPTTEPTTEPSVNWTLDPEISFYGPGGFYGRRTACGLTLTKDLKGVANRTLPCGTLVTFEWKGKTLTVPVVDRGPYVSGRIFDLTGGACTYLNHCFTGPINYRIGK